MAAVRQQLQSSRRPGHVAANTTRPLQQPAPAAHFHAPPPPLVLFVTNLKLLDLDLLPDWPGISPETFAATGATQGQKRRIQCVEWALFNLFALWDPEEVTNVQSLNLRAAFLRSLEQAKKNGVLGRDAVLRKTMLDECKGERFEEVLAVFSTAVLKKVWADHAVTNGEHPAIALRLALSQAVDPRGGRDERAEISTLILAHRISLQRLWEQRQEMDARYRDFSDLLGVKERTLARKREEARLRSDMQHSDEVSDETKKAMRRLVRTNWSGNERWMDTLLYGDATSNKDGTFSMPFDRVWRRVEQDRLGELEARDSTLLEQLDGRVRLHQDRLEKWQRYRKSMFGQSSHIISSPSKPTSDAKQNKGIDLGFGAHESLNVGRISPQKRPTSLKPRLTKEYHGILDSLHAELAENEIGRPQLPAFMRGQKTSSHLQPPPAAEEPISEISDLDDDSTDAYLNEKPIQSFQAKLETAKLLQAEQSDDEVDDALMATPKAGSKKSPTRRTLIRDSSNDAASFSSQSPSRDMTSSRQSPTRVLYPAEDHTQQLADQILESMNTSSPSPSKRSKPRHTLSLADRTRLSMAPRGSSIFLEGDEPEPEPEHTWSRTKPEVTTIPTKAGTGEDAPESEEPDDLVSRTRRSMAGFEKARQKAQLDRRRSQRRSKLPPQRKESYFGKVEEEDMAGDQSTLAEDLMVVEDMEAVFRSRPKIAASPLPSPTREMGSDGAEYM